MNNLLVQTLISLLFVGVYSNDEDPSITTCQPFDCGKIKNLSYPFWEKSKPQHCDHPGFVFDCNSDKDHPVITVNSQKFLVLKNIDPRPSRVLKLARMDFSETICPKNITNTTTFESTPFDYTPRDQLITLLYDCDPLNVPNPSSFDCPINGVHRSAYAMLSDQGYDHPWTSSCKVRVVVPVLRERLRDDYHWFDIHHLVEVLKEGFEVEWKDMDEDECKDCVDSGGTCGRFDYTANEFVCFCYYRNRKANNKQSSCVDVPAASPGESKASSSSSGINYKAKIGIGIGAGFGGIIIMCVIFLGCQYRRKKMHSSAILLSRSISSNVSMAKDIETASTYLGVHVFTYDELVIATNNFDCKKELGDGGFGTVYYGKLKDGRAVAVKRLYENNYRRVEQFMNEIEILAHVRHVNLVSLYGCTSRHSRELLLVYEFVPNGTVADHLHGDRGKSSGGLSWATRLNIAVETANALAYLHASEIIHRDVKTNNILLDKNFTVKVADFGLSRLFPTHMTHVSTAPQGTPGYVDPDYHQCYQLTSKSDVFSFGVVLMELVSSMPAVDITRHRHDINLSTMAINRIQNHALGEIVDPTLGFDSDPTVRKMITAVAELAFQCLQHEKDMRPCMGAVLEELKTIQSRDYGDEKAAKMVDASSADDAVLLKNGVLTLSPDSVTVNWVSRNTTPHASN